MTRDELGIRACALTYCAKRPGKHRVLMTVRLSRGGKAQAVRRG